jgi:type IV pilus assembly protein PilB
MADVDAVRHLASEHDLEFVDLDIYGVDPAASEILPVGLARQHHMVAIKRKFGTPVIAIADPDDDDGHDAIREAIGRDFISVVASEGQITDYLDRLFGPASEGDGRSEKVRNGRTPEDEPAEAPRAGEAEALGRSLVELHMDDLGAAQHGSKGKANGLSSNGHADAPELVNEDELNAVLESLTIAPETPDPVVLVTDLDERLDSDQDGVDQENDANKVAATDSDPEDLADLVAEAVATYQEQHGEEGDGGPIDGEPETASFPMLAKALVAGERVSVDEMHSALEESQLSGQNVAHVLMARGLVTESDLMWGMAQEMGLEFVDLDTAAINFTAVATLPEATARHHNVIVIAEEDGIPVVAASNPTDVFAMDDLRTIIGRRFKIVVATRSQITSYIDKAFDTGADEAAMEASMGIDTVADGGPDDIQAVTEEAPIVRYVNLLILQALNERASDIHIEPTGGELRIRYRIDGVLHDVSNAPRSIRAAVTTRLKVMADMNIAEHRIPQDGRISLNVGSKGIDLRMATLPTINGEKVVMRVLDKSSVVLGFTDLGFDEDLIEKYRHIYTKPYGTILVTGPTGSGKSTTLYTTLSELNSPEKNIITVEDPVELPLKGISQIQLNPRAGLTFASALRAILRSDPDIVLVGEIRDKETALISVEAALTGHLVLSTLHTNNAAATPMRLIEMGLEPFLVTSALSGVLAQRLARRLCIHCKEAYEPTEADIIAAGWSTEEVEAMGGIDKVYRSVGCSACSNTGYRGRKALAELLPMTEEVERMIIEGGSMEDIHRLGVNQGMVTLRQSGLRKALEGETTLEEVLRVVA